MKFRSWISLWIPLHRPSGCKGGESRWICHYEFSGFGWFISEDFGVTIHIFLSMTHYVSGFPIFQYSGGETQFFVFRDVSKESDSTNTGHTGIHVSPSYS